LNRFEASLQDHGEDVREQFYSANFARLFALA
jgi:hypothetical protein